MSRLVAHEERSPLKLDREDFENSKENVAICRCGLADSYPFCDGTHRITEDEAREKRYHYPRTDGDRPDENAGADEHADGKRRVVERIVYAEE